MGIFFSFNLYSGYIVPHRRESPQREPRTFAQTRLEICSFPASDAVRPRRTVYLVHGLTRPWRQLLLRVVDEICRSNERLC